MAIEIRDITKAFLAKSTAPKYANPKTVASFTFNPNKNGRSILKTFFFPLPSSMRDPKISFTPSGAPSCKLL